MILPEKSEKWRRQAASDGCAQAQYELGRACMNKLHIPDTITKTDLAGIETVLGEAEKWFGAAAAQGHEEGAECLAVLNRLRRLLAKEFENKLTAEDEFALSSLNGSWPFMFIMSERKGEQLLYKAAEQGCAQAWDDLIKRGDSCITGLGKFAYDEQITAAAQKALGYYRKAAECGSAEAKEKLAEFDTPGGGAARD